METNNSKHRILGGILIVTGLFLGGAMGYLIFWLQDTIAHPGIKGRWNGGPEFTTATFRLFYSVLVFGVASLCTGLFQLLTGHSNKFIKIPVFLAALVLGYSLWALLSLDKTL